MALYLPTYSPHTSCWLHERTLLLFAPVLNVDCVFALRNVTWKKKSIAAVCACTRARMFFCFSPFSLGTDILETHTPPAGTRQPRQLCWRAIYIVRSFGRAPHTQWRPRIAYGELTFNLIWMHSPRQHIVYYFIKAKCSLSTHFAPIPRICYTAYCITTHRLVYGGKNWNCHRFGLRGKTDRRQRIGPARWDQFTFIDKNELELNYSVWKLAQPHRMSRQMENNKIRTIFSHCSVVSSVYHRCDLFKQNVGNRFFVITVIWREEETWTNPLELCLCAKMLTFT